MLPHVDHHTVHFSSTNYSIVNFIKTITGINWVTTEQSVWNYFMEPQLEIMDTYTILWSDELEKRKPGELNLDTPVCQIYIKPDGCIKRVYTHPSARHMGLATYLLCHVNSYPHVHVELPLDSEWITFFTRCNIPIMPYNEI
jgi:hypothetical protein